LIFDGQVYGNNMASEESFSSFLSISLYQSPPRGGKERLGRENTVVSFGEIKKASEIDTYINPGLWKD
jgi:hypothetical protein